MLYPIDDPVEAVEVKPADLARLDPEEFLNDTVIDFFIKCASKGFIDDATPEAFNLCHSFHNHHSIAFE